MNFESLLSCVNAALRETLHDDIDEYEQIILDFNERVYDMLLVEASVDSFVDLTEEMSVEALISSNEELVRAKLAYDRQFDELIEFDSSF